MAKLVEATEIAGASIYGVAQMSYTVDGVFGQDYAAALATAAFKEAVSIEQALSGYAEVVRQRQRKLEDLGTLMANLNYAAANLKTKEIESSDTASLPNSSVATSIAQKYGISNISGTMTRANIYKAQNNVQYVMDKEDNDLKQDLVSLNSFISKRDNAFSTASKLVRKANDAASNTIGNIGG